MQLLNSIELILYKSYADLKAEAARSYLGMLWWIIEPILYLCAFYILFVMVLHRGGPDFVSTFLCGTVVWKWFDSGLKGGAQTISVHRSLMQQVYVPKFVFPIIAVLGSTARFIPVFVIFLIFLWVSDVPVTKMWLIAPLIIVVQFLLVVSLAMLIGAVTPFLPDLRVAIDQALMMLFFLSGIFFNINEVNEPLKSYLLLNPMAGLIDEYRNILIRGIWPDFERLGKIALASLAMGALGLVLLKQLDHKYGKIPF